MQVRDHEPTTVAQPVAAAGEMLIAPRKRWQLIDLGEVWRYRHLLWILAARDVKVRYKQTMIGAAWAILQPLFTAVVFAVLFRLVHAEPTTGDVPYIVTAFCALLPWQLFATALAQSSDSLVSNQSLITKVYFPRVIVPISPIIASMVDFALAFVVLLGMMAWFGVVPTWAVVTLPLLVLLAAVTALSVSLWLSALNALYRDVRYMVPFLVQIGMFVSPVVYETDALDLSPTLRALYSLNPMVGVIEGFRWALLGRPHPPLAPMAISVAAMLVVLTLGSIYFRRVERTIADRV